MGGQKRAQKEPFWADGPKINFYPKAKKSFTTIEIVSNRKTHKAKNFGPKVRKIFFRLDAPKQSYTHYDL